MRSGLLSGRFALLSCIVAAAFDACSGGSASSDAGTDGGVCSHPPTLGDLPSYESVASGTVTATNLSALVCNVDVKLVSSPTDGSTPGPVSVDFGFSEESLVDFQLPAKGQVGLLQGSFQIAAPSPGIYASSGAMCGAFYFSFGFPVVPSADCDGGTSLSCPAGCAPACADASCDGCVPFRSVLEYQASSATNCLVDTPQQVTGSWTLVLQSVVQDGPTTYTAHGTLSAVLTGPQGAAAAMLALAF
jgi:hypothetical protein